MTWISYTHSSDSCRNFFFDQSWRIEAYQFPIYLVFHVLIHCCVNCVCFPHSPFKRKGCKWQKCENDHFHTLHLQPFRCHQKVCSQRHGSLADALASAISSCSLQPACHRYLLTRTVTASGRAKAKRLLNIHCGVRRLQAVGALSQLEERLLQRSNQIVHVNHKPEIARNNVNNKRQK